MWAWQCCGGRGGRVLSTWHGGVDLYCPHSLGYKGIVFPTLLFFARLSNVPLWAMVKRTKGSEMGRDGAGVAGVAERWEAEANSGTGVFFSL